MKLKAARHDQIPLFKLCDRICQYQVKHGRHSTLENPQKSSLWQQPVMRPIGRVTAPVTFDQCAFHQGLPKSRKLIRKRTTLWTTSLQLLQSFQDKWCQCKEPHQRVEGSHWVQGRRIQVSAYTAAYPAKMASHVARCICSGYRNHVTPEATACPTFEAPKVRNFKSAGGPRNPPVTEETPSQNKRVADPIAAATKTSLSQGLKRRRIGKSKAPLPGLETTPPDDPQWLLVFDALSRVLPRRGIVGIPLHLRPIVALKELLPSYEIVGVYVTKGGDAFQMPLGAPALRDAPWRLTYCMRREDTRVISVATEDLSQVDNHDLRSKCVPFLSMLTIFARKVATAPDSPPAASMPTASPEAPQGVVVSDRHPAKPRLERMHCPLRAGVLPRFHCMVPNTAR